MADLGFSRQYAVAGIGEWGLGKAPPGSTALSLQCSAAREALLDAAMPLSQVDGVFAHWDDRSTALLVSEYLGIQPRYIDTTFVGGQSNLTQLVHAIAAIESGLCDVALVTYGSTQRQDQSRRLDGNWQDARLPSGQFAIPYGVPNPIGYYAMLAQLYMNRHDSRPEDLGIVALSARRWAQLNDAAVRKEPLTMDDYLSSPMIADPLRRLDICQVNDGSGALVLTTLKRALDCQRPPVIVSGFGDSYQHHMTPLAMTDWLDYTPLGQCTERALTMANMTREDMDFVQIYDAFSINVLTGLEAMGFCAPGQAGDFMHTGNTQPGGDFPLNTSGGGLSFNHSGQFGMQLMIEAVRQLRGDCGARQVPGAQRGLVQAGGMVMSAYMVMALEAQS